MDTVGAAAPSVRRVLPAVVWFDWLVLAVCSWLVGGGYLDAGAHRHVLTLDTFFTPWHGVLYTGYAACVTVLGGRWLRTPSLPGGYQLSLLGCGIFAVGGLSDLLWHTIFGIERNIAATLSASHLLLIVAMGLIVTGPLRASRAVRGRRAPATAVVGAALVFSYLGLVTQFAQPYLDRLAAGPSVLNDMPYGRAVELGLFGVMLQTALLVGLALLVPNHPDVAHSLNSVGMLLYDQGDVESAEPYLERALAIRETVLGSTHLDTATSLNNLARLLRDRGRLAAAKELLGRALAINATALGPEHLNTAHCLHNLGIVLRDQSDFMTATTLLGRALAIREKTLGPDHLDTAASRRALESLPLPPSK